jgi:hypothetical protein
MTAAAKLKELGIELQLPLPRMTYDEAMERFDAARRPACRKIARQAAFIAKVGADLGGGLRQSVRNSLLRMVPARALALAGSSAVGCSARRKRSAAA